MHKFFFYGTNVIIHRDEEIKNEIATESERKPEGRVRVISIDPRMGETNLQARRVRRDSRNRSSPKRIDRRTNSGEYNDRINNNNST